MEDSLAKLDNFRLPVLSYYLPFEFAIEVFDVCNFLFRNVKVSEAVFNEVVADTSKRISEVKPGYVYSFLFVLSILDYFLQNLDMLNTAIDALEEGLLCACVDVTIGNQKVGHLLRFYLVVWLTKARS